MEEEYWMKDEADIAVADLNLFLDLEQQAITEAHSVHEKLLQLELIIGHLDERIPEENEALHDLNGKITDAVEKLGKDLEDGVHKGLQIVNESKHRIQGIQEGIKQKDWKAVKDLSEKEKNKEDELLSLETKELRTIHSKFLEIMKLMKRSNLIEAIKKGNLGHQEAERFLNEEEHYFTQIYNLIRVYEKVFRQLWEKEMALRKK